MTGWGFSVFQIQPVTCWHFLVFFLSFLNSLRCNLQIPLKWSVNFLKSQTSTGNFLNLNQFICNQRSILHVHWPPIWDRGNHHIESYLSSTPHQNMDPPWYVCCWFISNDLQYTKSRSWKLIMVSNQVKNQIKIYGLHTNSIFFNVDWTRGMFIYKYICSYMFIISPPPLLPPSDHVPVGWLLIHPNLSSLYRFRTYDPNLDVGLASTNNPGILWDQQAGPYVLSTTKLRCY